MQKISDYIIGELKRTLNSDVNKIMLSGGVTETYGLIDYLEKQLREARLSVDIVTFDDYRSDDDTFTILSNEDSTFCAGGRRSNSYALMGYQLKTAVALSYGTWLYNKNINKKILDVFFGRGRVIPQNGAEYSCSTYVNYREAWADRVKNEEIFSTTLGKKET